MNTDLTQLAERLDALVVPLLTTARQKKELDQTAMSEVRKVIADIADATKQQSDTPKKLVGSLYFIVFSLLSEADHAKNPEPLSTAAWTLQEDLRRVFGPRF